MCVCWLKPPSEKSKQNKTAVGMDQSGSRAVAVPCSPGERGRQLTGGVGEETGLRGGQTGAKVVATGGRCSDFPFG